MGKPEDFHRRLTQACDDNPNIPPYGHGRQVWVAKKVNVTQEAVRKWFTGEARPRTDKMRLIANLLEVDEAWLALGIAPEMDRKEKRDHHARIDGAVHLLFGMFSLAGGHCAFPSEKDSRSSYVDFYVIIRGAQLAVHVCVGRETSRGQYEFVIPHEHQHVVCIGVIPQSGMRFNLIDLKDELVEAHKSKKGGDYSVTVSYRDSKYATGRDEWPRVKYLGDL